MFSRRIYITATDFFLFLPVRVKTFHINVINVGISGAPTSSASNLSSSYFETHNAVGFIRRHRGLGGYV